MTQAAADGQHAVAFLMANEGVEQVELTRPWEAVEQAGLRPVLVAPGAGQVQAFRHLDKGDTFDVDVMAADAKVDDYVALVLPGGVANPDALRLDDDAVVFVRDFTTSGKLVAAICHAPWSLVEADVVKGRTLTSWPSLRTDLTNAGATWVDEQLVVCEAGPGPLVTSRKPDDLPAFCAALTERLVGSAT
ncbi:MAG TPA: type 1 glutamine amidotransferase domain-containing protein [Actinomycetales bacterium]|nr:type 1 glutamine amidotransferase domain-containing protein [Actinomycetales bacterium]